MGDVLLKRLCQTKPLSTEQDSLLNIMVASNYIKQDMDQICQEHGITRGQYNVLRILNGAFPAGYPRYEIIRRMIEPAPDVTRLIDRLVKAGYVRRQPNSRDKRQSVAVITEVGQDKLDAMNAAMVGYQNSGYGDLLTLEEHEVLSRLLEKVYAQRLESTEDRGTC